MKRLALAFIIILCLVLGVAVLIVIYGTPADEVQRPSPDQTQILSVSETDPTKGSAGAPVTVIVMSSFNCPACKDLAAQLDQLNALYPEKIRIVWKDLPDSIGDAYQAAIAARCAQLQGRFWQYHDVLFSKQDLLASRTLYTLWAEELRMSVDRFDACLDAQETKQWVDANIAEGLRIGVERVPHVQIGGATYEGPQTLGFYRVAIEQALEDQET